MTISTETAGATIRYTTDGVAPTATGGIVYQNPIVISTTTPLKAIAYKEGMNDSTITSGVFTLPAWTDFVIVSAAENNS